MDQNKTNVPHLLHSTKSTQNLWRLRTHLTGILVHTKSTTGKLAYGFYDILQFPHDSNLTINSLLRVLVDVFSAGNSLPRVLYLQLDNCFRENKNKYLFSFCSLLVQKELFQKVHMINVFACILIQISYFLKMYVCKTNAALLDQCIHNSMPQVKVNFLPVGHTHEDVDQFFSKVSTYLTRNGAETLPG